MTVELSHISGTASPILLPARHSRDWLTTRRSLRVFKRRNDPVQEYDSSHTSIHLRWTGSFMCSLGNTAQAIGLGATSFLYEVISMIQELLTSFEHNLSFTVDCSTADAPGCHG